jgi:hypothetical protein
MNNIIKRITKLLFLTLVITYVEVGFSEPVDNAMEFAQLVYVRCQNDQKGKVGNENVSDEFITKVCGCLAVDLASAVQGGLIDGADKIRTKDIVLGRQSILLLECTKRVLKENKALVK